MNLRVKAQIQGQCHFTIYLSMRDNDNVNKNIEMKNK